MRQLTIRTLLSMPPFCFVAIIVGGLLLPETANAGSETRMALFELANKSDNKLSYKVKWGENGSWKSYTIKPGAKRLHWWNYDYSGENKSPRPYIRFDADLTKGIQWDMRWAQAYAAPEADSKYAKKYVFKSTGEVLNILQA